MGFIYVGNENLVRYLNHNTQSSPAEDSCGRSNLQAQQLCKQLLLLLLLLLLLFYSRT